MTFPHAPQTTGFPMLSKWHLDTGGRNLGQKVSLIPGLDPRERSQKRRLWEDLVLELRICGLRLWPLPVHAFTFKDWMTRAFHADELTQQA